MAAYTLNRGLSLLGLSVDGLDTLLAVFNAVAIIAFSHLSLHQTSTKLETSEPKTQEIKVQETEKPEAKATLPERKSCLPSERMQRIADKLASAMEQDKLFADNELSLHQLADVTNTSAKHISETFSQHLQTNFFEFVNQYRISEAKRLLETSDQSVTTIAFEVGYNSCSTFNSKFKQDTSMTPTGYRKHVQNMDIAK